jgi:ABC-type Fe3+-citrate transport system substrate-binding protein
LCVSGAFKKSSEVCEALIHNLDSKPWKVKSTNAHPAGLYCNPQYDYFTHFLRGLCYQQMIAQSSRGENNTTDVEHVNKEKAELLSLYAQSEYSEVFSYERYRLVESFEYLAKNKYDLYTPLYPHCFLFCFC